MNKRWTLFVAIVLALILVIPALIGCIGTNPTPSPTSATSPTVSPTISANMTDQVAGEQFVTEVLGSIQGSSGWTLPLPLTGGQMPRVLTEEEKDKVLEIASAVPIVVEVKQNQDITSVDTSYKWVGWNGYAEGASFLNYGAVENGTANLSDKGDTWFPAIDFLFHSRFGEYGKVGIQVAVNLQTGKVAFLHGYASSFPIPSKIPPIKTDQPTGEPQTPLPTAMQAEIAGQWKYDFPQNYDPEIGFADAITIISTSIKGKDYLILSFDPLSGPNNSRVFIFDTENPLSPQLVSTIAREKQGRDASLVRSTAVQNNILYASLFLDKGLWMVDISNPAEPKDLGIAPVKVTSNLVVSGSQAYASGQLYNGVTISNISDPQNVREVSRIDINSRDCRLAVSGQRLFIGIQTTLTVVDISVPETPKVLSSYDLNVPDGLTKELLMAKPGQSEWNKWASIIDLQARGNYVYVTFGAGQLRVIDVSDPTSPREARQVEVGGFAIALTLKDDLLFLTKSDKENPVLQLCVLDVSQPQSPTLLDSVETQSMFGLGGATFAYCFMRPVVLGDHVYVASRDYIDVIEFR